MEQLCSRWGCDKTATYEKPLCYKHWLEFEGWELEECNLCHWYYAYYECYEYDSSEFAEEYPFMCDNCFTATIVEDGKRPPVEYVKIYKQPVTSHADIERPLYYIYILKLSDAKFYVGKTHDLTIRLQEHKDGQQKQTNGKDPKLVYYETFKGDRRALYALEDELTLLNTTAVGRRTIRKMIEDFRVPLRLLDLEA
ncbi:GIY-YIG nuclease family protein [Chloroflexota bacterium]